MCTTSPAGERNGHAQGEAMATCGDFGLPFEEILSGCPWGRWHGRRQRATRTARIGSSCDVKNRAWNVSMRTTLALDDDLLAEAQRLTGTSEKSALVRQALRALIERESARRLARLGGSEPGLTAPTRRRPAPR